MRYLLLVLMFACPSFGQCKYPFSVVVKDDLNNVRQGLSSKLTQWATEKMAKKYPSVCYSENTEDIVFYVSTKPAIYHGTQTVSNGGTINDETNGQVLARTETSQEVPIEVPYKKLFLVLETKTSDSNWEVRHVFQGETLYNRMYGFCTHNCHPEQKLYEEAIKWLHEGGLTDPKQTRLP